MSYERIDQMVDEALDQLGELVVTRGDPDGIVLSGSRGIYVERSGSSFVDALEDESGECSTHGVTGRPV